VFLVRYELRFCVPDDGILHSHLRETPKSYITCTIQCVSQSAVPEHSKVHESAEVENWYLQSTWQPRIQTPYKPHVYIILVKDHRRPKVILIYRNLDIGWMCEQDIQVCGYGILI
jgi:hypothetical protein